MADADDIKLKTLCERHGLQTSGVDYALARVVEVAAIATQSAYAAFSMSIEDGQVYFESHGLEFAREVTSATPCFREADQSYPRAFTDLRREPSWRDHPVVVGTPSVRGYYGIAILAGPEKQVVGTLAVMDSRPRDYRTDPDHMLLLNRLGRLIEDILLARRDVARDPLTGLFNRRFTNAHVVTEWNRAQRLELPISVALIDIDNFKDINDELGHGTGDKVIEQVATLIQQSFRRASDTVSRFGGDEFSVVSLTTPLEGAIGAAEKTLRAVADANIYHPSAEQNHRVTLSIGITTYSHEGHISGYQPDAIFDLADEALYEAKRAGRNCVRYKLPPGPES